MTFPEWLHESGLTIIDTIKAVAEMFPVNSKPAQWQSFRDNLDVMLAEMQKLKGLEIEGQLHDADIDDTIAAIRRQIEQTMG